MALTCDPLGLLSPPYSKDCNFSNDIKDLSDTVNHCNTDPLPSWDATSPSDYPAETPTQHISPIDPVSQSLTEEMDNAVSSTHDSAQLPSEQAEHSTVGQTPSEKGTTRGSSHAANDSDDASAMNSNDKRRERRESRQSSSTNDSHSRIKKSKGKHQEKNRLAASKSRQKKKKENEKLEAQSKVLEDEQARLKATADMLQSEVLLLKNEVLKHGLCSDCEQIQKYISESANRLVREQ
ncbi:hypothetical protein F4810DRAFT_648032 [Camillea tinctor]|nr:hypothetical protein F4810DRAFT_648032 [Camillea tinctor]